MDCVADRDDDRLKPISLIIFDQRVELDVILFELAGALLECGLGLRKTPGFVECRE